jgi:hypothetical protein
MSKRRFSDEEIAEAKRFWAEFAALGYNINKIDPNDPVWTKPQDEDNENTKHGD